AAQVGARGVAEAAGVAGGLTGRGGDGGAGDGEGVAEVLEAAVEAQEVGAVRGERADPLVGVGGHAHGEGVSAGLAWEEVAVEEEVDLPVADGGGVLVAGGDEARLDAVTEVEEWVHEADADGG